MTPEQLQAALNALMEAGLDGDALTAATKALTDAFGANVEVSDDEAVDAMPPDMASSYRAADTKAEDKATLLETAKHFVRGNKLSIVPAMIEKAKLSKGNGKEEPITRTNLAAIVKEAVTKALPGQGRHASTSANPVGPNAKTGPASFSAKIKGIEKAEGCQRGVAVLKARKEDPAGYNEWCAANRPD